MLPPVFDDNLCLNPISEPFHRQIFITEFSVETLRRPVLPGLSWVNQRAMNALLRHPSQQRDTDELGAIVTS
jgi:hypothetical protein